MCSRLRRSSPIKKRKRGYTVSGLGKLVLVDRKERMGRNRATGQEIVIPAKRTLKFKVAKTVKDMVAGARG
jgi:DNA-binding protein HU-beta